MKRAAIYTRISSDPSGERLGVQRQEEECRALCERKRWTVAEVFEDDDRSAYSGKPRPGYVALLDAVKAGEVDALVSWAPDRLHRSPRELEDFIDLVERTGVAVQTVQSGEWNLSSSDGRMAARVVGAVARAESERKSERAKSKARQLAKAGKLPGGGSRPFGFEPDRLTIRPSEARLIREAVQRVTAGESLHRIAVEWTETGVATISGRPWRTQTLRRMFTSARIAGHRELDGKLYEAEWDGIITLDELHAIRAVLHDPGRLKWRNPRRYLLTGFAFCALCGEKLVARPNEHKRRKYVCSTGANFTGCGKIACVADELEALIVGAIQELIRDANLEQRLAPKDDDPVQRAEVEEVERRLDELAEMFAKGEIGRREWSTARESLADRLSALRAAESAAVGKSASRTDVRHLRTLSAAWDDLPVERQRAIVDLFVDRVTIGPAVQGRNFFDPDRVDVTWKV